MHINKKVAQFTLSIKSKKMEGKRAEWQKQYEDHLWNLAQSFGLDKIVEEMYAFDDLSKVNTSKKIKHLLRNNENIHPNINKINDNDLVSIIRLVRSKLKIPNIDENWDVFMAWRLNKQEKKHPKEQPKSGIPDWMKE